MGSGCEALDGELRHDLPDMDQPHRNAALGTQSIRTIGREELKAKLDAWRKDVGAIMPTPNPNWKGMEKAAAKAE